MLRRNLHARGKSPGTKNLRLKSQSSRGQRLCHTMSKKQSGIWAFGRACAVPQQGTATICRRRNPDPAPSQRTQGWNTFAEGILAVDNPIPLTQITCCLLPSKLVLVWNIIELWPCMYQSCISYISTYNLVVDVQLAWFWMQHDKKVRQVIHELHTEYHRRHKYCNKTNEYQLSPGGFTPHPPISLTSRIHLYFLFMCGDTLSNLEIARLLKLLQYNCCLPYYNYELFGMSDHCL